MSDVNETISDEHAWARQQMAAASAGGLEDHELARFEAHVRTCTACGEMWEKVRGRERELEELFADARPKTGFEDRIIRNLRFAGSQRRLVHPAVRWAATGIAAAIVLGGVGLMVNSAMKHRGTPSDGRGAIAMDVERYGPATTQPTLAATPTFGRFFRGANVQFRSDFDRSSTDWREAKQNSDYLSFGDGIVNWHTNPLPGVQSDDSAFGRTAHRSVRQYWDVTDSVMLPTDEKAGKDAGVKVGAGSLVLSGGTAGAPGVVGKELGEQSGRRQSEAAAAEAGRGVSYFATSNGAALGANVTQNYTWFKPAELGSASDQANAPKAGERGRVDVVRGGEVALGVDAPKQVEQQVRESGEQQGQQQKGTSKSKEDVVELYVDGFVMAGQEGRPAVQQQQVKPAATQKIIRTGQMEFEVERFDSAFAIVSKLVGEAGGYIGSTNSEKLPNGKVKGTVTVRVPPERLDTLVLQLRSLGDLRSQKLEAQDISKQYQDLDGELTAARAMETRLLEIIKTGKGEIKDLLAAEKELGVWRGKIEKIVGEMKYFDNLVGLSTLAITMQEKDVNTVASATETETVDAGVETVDVEKARSEALKAIDEAKGRVVQSELKKYDAGQFGATIVAEVSADRAGPLIDRIKQLGKVARLEMQRKQTDSTTGPGTRVERKATRINLSIYNLANVAPRTTTTMAVAVDDAEAAYRAVLARVEKAGGRVVTSNLARPKSEQVTGTIGFEVPAAEADALTNELKASGEVMNLTSADNPDTQNSTTAKRGFSVQVLSVTGVAPRETATVAVAASVVGDARNLILDAARAAAARILTAQLNESDRQNVTAALDLEIRRDKLADLEKALAAAGDIVSRSVNRSADAESTIDSKLRMQISLMGVEKLPPREATNLAVEVKDVEAALASLQANVGGGGKIVQSNLSKDKEGRVVGKVMLDVPRELSGQIIKQAREMGTVRVYESASNPSAPEGKLSRARVEVTFGNARAIVGDERTAWMTVRNTLWGVALAIVVAVIGWVGWKSVRRSKAVA